MRIKAKLTALVFLLSAGLCLPSCSNEPPEPDGGEDTPGEDTPVKDEEEFHRINFVESNATAINGFAARVSVSFDHPLDDHVTDWGVSVSINRQNLERIPEQRIRDITDEKDQVEGSSLSVTLMGLDGEETYYCRPFIQSKEGTMKWGDIMEFTTPRQEFFLQQTSNSALSAMKGETSINTENRHAALNRKYRDVETKLVNVSLDKYQYSLKYYEKTPSGIDHPLLLWRNEDIIGVEFNYLPPGAQVSFNIALMCDGEQKFLSPTYTVNSKKIVEQGMVDLNLSVNWAACNLGASSPWDIGTYHTYDEAMALDQADGSWRLPNEQDITQMFSQCTFIPVSTDNMQRGMLVMRGLNSIILPLGGTSDDEVTPDGYHIGCYWTSDEYLDPNSVHDKSRAWAMRLWGMQEADLRFERIELIKKYGLNVRPVYPRKD